MKRSVYLGLIITLAFLFFCSEGLPGIKRIPVERGLEKQPIFWYERGVKKTAWMALDEIAVFFVNEKITDIDQELLIQLLPRGATVLERNDSIIRLKLPEPMERNQILERFASIPAGTGSQARGAY
ncbi:MAG: hypothetical protein JRI34_13845 [Deltaproteobacteria bacterium]|nr:hypothetical protein [Deltaproteobacteria bacterium]